MSSAPSKAISAIEKRLDDYIRATNVLPGGSIEHRYDSTHIALGKEVMKHSPWKDYLGGLDVHEIVSGQMYRALQEVAVNERTGLPAILGPEAAERLKQNILSYLASIPRSYYVCFALPGVKLAGISRIVLTQDVDLLSVSKGDPSPAFGITR